MKRPGFCSVVVVRGFRVPRNYPREFQDRAVRLVEDRLRVDPGASETSVIADTAMKLGTSREFSSVVQSRVGSGTCPGVSTSQSEEIRRLRKKNAQLRRTNEILKLASAFFASELDPQGRTLNRLHRRLS